MKKINASIVTTIGLIVAIVFGFFFPYLAFLKDYIFILLFLVLFFTFMKLEFNIKKFFKVDMLIYPIFVWGIIPFVAFNLSAFLPIEDNLLDIRIGILMISITPTALGGSVIVDLIGGNRELSVSNGFFSNILSIITYPILLGLYLNNQSIDINIFLIFIKVFALIGIPFMLAILVRKFFSQKSKRLIVIGSKVSPFLIMCIVLIIISSNSHQIRSYDFKTLLFISIFVFSMAILTFGAGYLFARDKDVKKTMAVSMGYKNNALAIWIAISNFSPITTIPLAIYIIAHHTMNIILIAIFSKKSSA